MSIERLVRLLIASCVVCPVSSREPRIRHALLEATPVQLGRANHVGPRQILFGGGIVCSHYEIEAFQKLTRTDRGPFDSPLP